MWLSTNNHIYPSIYSSIYLLLIYLEKGDSSLVLDLDDQMESVRANINYLQDNILECQQNILQMEQAGGLYILESPFFKYTFSVFLIESNSLTYRSPTPSLKKLQLKRLYLPWKLIYIFLCFWSSWKIQITEFRPLSNYERGDGIFIILV